MIKLSLRNPLASLMLSVALIVFAAVLTPRMSVDTFPDLTPPVLVVGTLAPGLAAKDVEKTLTWRIEKYVSATPGVERVQSISRNNLSIVFVWLAWGTDLNGAQTLVQQQTAFAMAAVPKSLGALPPFVLQYDPSNAPVIQVAVSGGGLSGAQLYDYALNNIEPLLEGIPGVASASLNGGTQRQINIIVDPVAAQSRGITADDVAAAVAESNALLPSGEFITPQFDSNVYTNAVPRRVRDIGDLPAKISGNRAVLIRDVARVHDGGSAPTQSVAVNGIDAVYLNVLRVPGGNTLEIVDRVKQTLAGIRDLPRGVEVKPVFDQSTFVRTSYHGLKTEIVRALFLIAIVILVFLQSLRSTAIAAVTIPVAFAVTLIVLKATGQTLNAFTLGGLTLAMGPLIDTTVVVLESITRHQREGRDPFQAALEGAGAVALPVLASTLTTMAVLLPVLLLAGLAQKLFAPLALTVAVAMMAAYLVSMLVAPVACRYLLKPTKRGRVALYFENTIDRAAERYSATLRGVLRYRWFVIGVSAALTASALWATTRLPSTFFPEIDESMERVYVRFAPGMSLDESSRRINDMAKALANELPKGEVELVLTNIGSPNNARSAMTSPNDGPHMGFIRVALVSPERRKHSQREIADVMRALLNRRFPGVELLQWPGGLVASVFANGYIAPMVIEVRNENLEVLEQQARAVQEVARDVPGIRDTEISLQTDYPELHVDTVREEAGIVGVSPRLAAQATLEATLGNINKPSVWIDPSNGQSYYVVTSYDGDAVPDPNALALLPAKIAGNGKVVTIGAYADLYRSVGPVAIERDHMTRIANVMMQTERRDIGSAASELERRLRADPRTRGIDFGWVGQVDLMRTTFSGLGLAIGIALMVVFMLMAIQFKSLRLPLVMFFTIPATSVGVVLALMIAGQGVSITALMGVLMVVGIAVSNGILLVHEAARRLEAGETVVDAMVHAARRRFVPIAMTSLATIVGLVPTAIALEAGTEANQPLALAVVGGLTSSTVLSLFLVPCIFVLLAKKASEELRGRVPGPLLA